MVILQKFDFTDFLWVDKKQSSTEPKFTWLSTNAYEEEGIAYCFGYGAGEVAQFVVGSKLASKLKGGKVKASAFGYMDADDALRYNQYWDDVAKGLYNNPYGGKLSLDEISRMQCGFDKIAQKNWEYELGLDRYNNRILDYHNENPINNAIKGVSKADILKNAGLDKIKIDEIVSIPKGTRPDPATYLSKEYMDMHLSQFDDGLSVIQTEWAYGRYSEINGFVGVPDDNTVFVLPKKYCDGVVLRANGDISIIEKELGFPKGYFSDGGGLVRVDVDDVTGLNLRLPSGNETGANSLWIPGGYTSGNVPEAISDIIPLKQATISRINVD